jgi:ferrous iron transport protein B
MAGESGTPEQLLAKADRWREVVGGSIHDEVTASIYTTASQVASEVVTTESETEGTTAVSWLDRLVTSRLFGIPVMIGLLAGVLWLTIVGANVPSAFLAGLLIEEGGLAQWFQEILGLQLPASLSVSLLEILHSAFAALNSPWWLTGFLVDGVYLGLAWVVSVMLPPMAIFFPLFTLLEDLGLLPRLAFNMDRFLGAVGGSGKQALTMAMGFGCNAAGVIACRIIRSPREKLIAILTNNFVPCNGRWPMLIMAASLFVAAGYSAASMALVSTVAVTAVALVGILATGVISLLLSRTLLKGTASNFALELPPYRRPQILHVLYTSFIDRTLSVLRRAIVCAAPAGGLIWLLHAIPVGQTHLFGTIASALEPMGRAIGLDGVILLAFIFAIPANEIVIPTVIMGYMNLGRMTEIDNPAMLFQDNGWTLLTAVCLMLFSVLHYPCTTTSWTIWAETRSVKWTLLANLIPLTLALTVCFLVAQAGFWFEEIVAML